MKQTIGEIIALLRKKKQITQTQLAEYLFVTPQTVSKWEVGSGTPDVSLLPKIAAFFNVSIDELFGLASMERARLLVSRYSVLRDEASFQDAANCIDLQLQAIEASLHKKPQEAKKQRDDKDTLKALQMHLHLQKGWECLETARRLADALIEQTKEDPASPWYLPIRLQQLQLCSILGQGESSCARCKKDFEEEPNLLTLQLYFEILLHLRCFEEILSLPASHAAAQGLMFPLSDQNSAVWRQYIEAAAKADHVALAEQYAAQIWSFLTISEKYDLLRLLAHLYCRQKESAKLEKAKETLLLLLPKLPYDEYFLEQAERNIRQLGQEP